ncbi:Hypothetical protein SMB2099_2716 [Serratia marcescens SMB2099]|nr:Hypothetical protein SMB2099_2716 [Serratia marcescens SMB2099]
MTNGMAARPQVGAESAANDNRDGRRYGQSGHKKTRRRRVSWRLRR